MRILILADSLGLPRPHRINNYSPDELELAVHYENVYASQIQRYLFDKYKNETFFEIINRSKRMCTIRDIAKDMIDYLFFYEPDIIVLQVGIVDCWFRENRYQIVDKIEFEAHLKEIMTLLSLRKKTKLIIIGICPTSIKMDKRIPETNQEIRRYNDILAKYVNLENVFYIDMEKYVKPEKIHEYLLPDDCHLNIEGNSLVAKEVLKIVEGLINTNKGVKVFEESDLENALNFFLNSYKLNPYYIDNLYNLLILAFENNHKELLNIIDFCKRNIANEEILELVNILTKKVTK